MARQGAARKLAAILSADAVGYSRLMDDDEEETVRTLTAYRNAMADLIQLAFFLRLKASGLRASLGAHLH